MAKYRVMQISMTDEQRLATTFNPTADAVFAAWDQYKSVAMIDADDLEHVFEIGNMGPEHRITRHGPPMHSVSVGDVVVDPACSTAWFVDTCGFGMLGTVYHGKAMGYGN